MSVHAYDKANLSFSFRLYFLYTPLVVCLSEINASESSSNLIQHAYIVFILNFFSYQFTAQIFANMFNTSTQRSAAVATSISPLSEPRDNPILQHTLACN